MQILVAGDRATRDRGACRRIRPPLVAVPIDQVVGETERRVEVSRLEGRLIDFDQGLDQAGVIVEVGGQPRGAVFVSVQQPPFGSAHSVEQEVGRAGRGRREPRFGQHAARPRHGGDHQARSSRRGSFRRARDARAFRGRSKSFRRHQRTVRQDRSSLFPSTRAACAWVFTRLRILCSLPVSLGRHVVAVDEERDSLRARAPKSTSSSLQTKNLPSSPSLSASCVL